MKYMLTILVMAFFVQSCTNPSMKGNDPEAENTANSDTDSANMSRPLYTYQIKYDNPKVDTISWKEVDDLVKFYGKFQFETHPLSVNFKAVSTSLSYQHNFPDYSIHYRRMAYVLDRMAGYFGQRYRVTSDIQTIDRKIEDFEKPDDVLIIEFGFFKEPKDW